MNISKLSVLAAVAAVGLVSTAKAVDVTDSYGSNWSFESNFVQTDQTGGYGGIVPNWAFQVDGGNAAGTNTRTLSSFSHLNDPEPSALNQGTGNNIGFINIAAPRQFNRAFTNAQGQGFTLGNTYTFTIALGNVSYGDIVGGNPNGDANYSDPGRYYLQMQNQAGTVLNSVAVNGWDPSETRSNSVVSYGAGQIEDGALRDFTVSYTPTAADFLPGGPLFLEGANNQQAIRFNLECEGVSANGGEQFSFDDLRLDISAVPEPTSIATLGLAGAAALLRRRRQA